MSRRLVPGLFAVLLVLALTSARGQPQRYQTFQPGFQPGPRTDLLDPGFQGKLDIPFGTQYIWRGVELNHQAVFQPALRLNDQGMEIEVIGNMDLTGSNDRRGKFSRVIYRAGLARRSRDGEVALSYFYYDNADVGYPKTQEIGLEIRWGYPFFFGTDIFWDFDGAHGFYFDSSTGIFIDAGPLRIIPEIGIGFATKKYQEFYFGVRQDTFLDWRASLIAELKIYGPIFVTVRGDYYELARKNLRRSELVDRQGDNFWGECSVSIRF